MKTAKYKAIRLLTQMLGILIIALNLYALGVAITNRVFSGAEAIVMSNAIISFYPYAHITLALNVIIALLVLCGITSGSKALIRTYRFLIKCTCCINIVAFIFFNFFYETNFSSRIATASDSSIKYINYTTSTFPDIDRKNVPRVLTGYRRASLDPFILSVAITFGMYIIIEWLSAMAVSTELFVPEPAEMRTVPISKRGLNTQSLQAQRVVEVLV